MTIIIGDNSFENDTSSAVNVYVPENFNARATLGCDGKIADAAKWFLDRLYLHSHFAMREDEWGFTTLKVAYLRKVIPQTFEKQLREQLLEAGVIETDGYYVEGRKSYGYRLCPMYQTRHRRSPITHPIIRRNIELVRAGDLAKLSAVHQHLHRQFDRLSIDSDHIQDSVANNPVWEDFSRAALEQLRTKEWTPVVCEYGRFHTPLTRLLTKARHGLRIDGKSLINIDIANSQPLFLALLFLKIIRKQTLSVNHLEEDKELLHVIRQLGVDISSHPAGRGPSYTMGLVNNREHLKEDVVKYLELVEQGQLYEFFGKNSLLSRQEFKEKFFKDVLYGQNYIASQLTRDFSSLFPNVMKFIRRIKQTNYRRLAWVMQKEESRLMIDTICGRIMREHPLLPLLTIHDSIMTTEENVAVVEGTIREEFAKCGVSPTIRMEHY